MTETFESDMKDNVGICEIETLVSNVDEIKGLEKIISRENRVEIDTSPPFESVKEAVTHFGGSGVWRPSSKSPEPKHISREVDATKVEEQASFLQKDLVIKERETLEVLKELETTKRLVEELKLKLQSEVSESVANSELILKSTAMIDLDVKQTDEQTSGDPTETNQNLTGDLSILPSSSPGMILMELKQAKVNLSRTTSDLADIRASVESLNKKLEKERVSLKKTRDRLTSNSSKILSLEEELNRTKRKLELAKDAELMATSDNRMDISKELHQLSSEAEQFKKMAEATKSEVLRATTEIEQTKTSIKTAEIRWVAAKKLAEAARASEAAALAEIKALSNSECSSEGITLSFEEYSSLATRAREAEELSKKRVLDAEVQVDEVNLSKIRILQKVEEAAKEVKTSEKALEKALNRVEAANRGKLAVEEALRKWRSEHGQKRRSVYNSSKFKNSCPSTNRRDSRMVNINGFNVVNDGSKPILKPTLSIGQILSRKLLMPDESDMEMQTEISTESPKVSLGEILGKQSEITSPPLNSANEGNDQKQYSAKRKKFGLTRFSLLLAKQNKKKKKQASPNSRWGACKGLDDA